MRATLVTVRDPFRPLQHRTVSQVSRRRRIRALAPKTALPHICLLNGRPVLRAEWSRKLRHGDVLAFVTLPQGGGDGGSNPLRMILMIVVMIFAPYVAPALGITGAAATAVTAVVTAAGIALVNALVPPPSPSGMGQQAASSAAASPTYSLGSQGNQARLGSPIPVIYGRHITYPDFAAQPYLEYGGNEQYLYQLMVIGQGEYDIEAIRIEDTDIANFDEIDYQIIPPGGTLTLFPANVVTSIEVAGQELLESVVAGPFVANPSGTFANVIGVDIVAPRGLYYAETDGSFSARIATFDVESRSVDDDGSPTGSWVTLGSEAISGRTTTPQRLSFRYTVTAGRYEVRVTRTNAKETATRGSNEIAWTGLRAYLRETRDYGAVTMIALRMRASNNLSTQASRRINLIVTRKVPTWSSGGGWTAPVATSNPAWALADIARADYGAGLADARLNLPALESLAATAAARGDECNIVFDSPGTIWDALTTVARTVRAKPFIQSGVLHVFRDQPATVPVAMFTPRNIARNSLSLQYIMPSDETADAVDVEYFDASVWRSKTVRAMLDGSSAAAPVVVTLSGVTSRDQAWREGMYMAASNRWRRRFAKFSTEMEGFVPSPGDLVMLTHDVPRWGQSSEVVAFDSSLARLATRDDLDFSAGGTHVLTWRGRDGRPVGPYTAVATTMPNVVDLTDWTDGIDPEPDLDPATREAAHVAFGPSDANAIRAKVLSIKPRSTYSVEVELIVESDAVHTADTGAPAGSSGWQLPAVETAPRIAGLVARSMPDNVAQMVITWAPAPGADRYLIEQSSGDGNWTRVGDTSAASYIGMAIYGQSTRIRVAAVGVTRGPWVEVDYGSTAGYMWSGAPSDLMWDADPYTLMWS